MKSRFPPLIKAFLKDQHGAMFITWTSIFMLVMCTFAALALDGGMVALRKHVVYSCADAGALAGATATEAKLVLDAGMNPVGEKKVINPIFADIFADQTVTLNESQMRFNQRGIRLQTRQGYSVDDNSDGDYDGYFLRLTGNVDAPLWGRIFGSSSEIPFSIPVRANMNE